MPDGFLENLAKITGNTSLLPKQPKTPRGGDESVARVVDDELSKLGWANNARLSFLGDVGRENNWNRKTIFGGHTDPASYTNGRGKIENRGIISWNGDRRTKLDGYLKEQGVFGKGDDDELRGMVRFADKEMRDSNEWKSIHSAVRNPNISTYDASENLRKYIKYVPDGEYNSYDPNFRVKNNATWAEKARVLGLAQGDATQTNGFLENLKSITSSPMQDAGGDFLSNLNSITAEAPLTASATPSADAKFEADANNPNLPEAIRTEARENYARAIANKPQAENDFLANLKNIAGGEQPPVVSAPQAPALSEQETANIATLADPNKNVGKSDFAAQVGAQIDPKMATDENVAALDLNVPPALGAEEEQPSVQPNATFPNGAPIKAVLNEPEKNPLDEVAEARAELQKRLSAANAVDRPVIQEQIKKVDAEYNRLTIPVNTAEQPEHEPRTTPEIETLGEIPGTENAFPPAAPVQQQQPPEPQADLQGNPFDLYDEPRPLPEGNLNVSNAESTLSLGLPDAEDGEYKKYLAYTRKADSPVERQNYNNLVASNPELHSSATARVNAPQQQQQIQAQPATSQNQPQQAAANTPVRSGIVNAPMSPDNLQKEVVGSVPFKGMYKQKPTAAQVFNDVAVQNYGASAPDAIKEYKRITGENLLTLANEEGTQGHIDTHWNPQTGEYTSPVAEPVFANVKDAVDAFNRSGEQGIKDLLTAKNETNKQAEESLKQQIADAEQINKNKENEAREAEYRQKAIEEINAENEMNASKYEGATSIYDIAANHIKPSAPTEDEITQRVGEYKAAELTRRQKSDAIGSAININKLPSPVAAAVGSFVGVGGDVANSLAGATRILKPLGIDVPNDFFSRVSQQSKIINENTGDPDSPLTKVIKFGGQTYSDISQIMILSSGGGALGAGKGAAGAIGFAGHAALKTAGEGGSIRHIETEGVRAALLNGVFVYGAIAGNAVKQTILKGVSEKAIGEALASDTISAAVKEEFTRAGSGEIAELGTAAARRASIAANIGGQTVNVGVIAAGTAGYGKAFGDTNEQIKESILTNAAFHLFNTVGEKAFEKVKGRVIRAWKNGESQDGFVDTDGTVKAFTEPVEDKFVNNEIYNDPANPVYQDKNEPPTGTDVEQSSIIPASQRTPTVGAIVTGEVRGKGGKTQIKTGKVTGETENQLIVETEEGGVVFMPKKKASVSGLSFRKGVNETAKPDENMQNNMQNSSNSNEPINSATLPAHEAATSPQNDLAEPTTAQREAGNYKLGHINVSGLNISVEIPVGGERKGVDKNGKPWSVEMQNHYGYIKRTVGADTENIDVFVKDHTPDDFAGDVFVVDQVHPDTGKFDEHKVMLGFGSEQEARAAYAANYAKDWKGLQKITAMPFDEFKNWTNAEQSNPVSDSIKQPLHNEVEQTSAKVDIPLTDEKTASPKTKNISLKNKKPVVQGIRFDDEPAAKTIASEPAKKIVDSAAEKTEDVKLNERTNQTTASVRESRPTKSATVGGKATSVKIPDSKRAYDAKYSVREIDDVVPSHNPFNFSPNEDYHFVNDRHYDKEKQYQTQVENRSKAENFDPSRLINNAPTVEVGTPVIDADGNVLGGNSRSMMLHRVYADENPAARESYRKLLIEDAAVYGLDPGEVARMKNPVLVREVSDSSIEAQHAITDLNKTSTTELTAQERAVAESNKLSDSAVEHITNQIERAGTDATLNDALNQHGVGIVNKLIDDGVFSGGERNSLLKDGRITEDGKRRIERLLTGRVFTDLEQMENVPPYLKRNLERVISPLIKTEADSDWNITPEVREAIDLLTEFNGKGNGLSLREYAKQPSMVRGGFSEKAVDIAEALKQSPNNVSRAFKGYAREFQDAKDGSALFGAMSPSDAFDATFKDSPQLFKHAEENKSNKTLRALTREEAAAKQAKVVAVEPHDFKNSNEAKDWADNNLPGDYVNADTEQTINVSKRAIEKYLSGKTVQKSSTRDAHLSTLKEIPKIIENAVLGETHADRKNDRNIKEIQRFYAAVNLDGEIQRVKLTVKAYETEARNKAYSYEVTKIETLGGKLTDASPDEGLTSNRTPSVSMSSLLENAQKNNGDLFFSNDSQVLHRAEKEKAYEDFNAIKHAPVSGIIESGTVERNGDRLKVNLEGQEFIRRAIEESDIRAGRKNVGDDAVEASFSGLFTDRKQTARLVKTLRDIGAEAKEANRSEASSFANNFADEIEAAAKAGQGTAVAYMYDSRVPHEKFHQASFLGDITDNGLTARHASPELLDRHEAASATADYLSQLGEYREIKKTNPEAFKALVREEAAAYIAGGDAETLGISDDSAADFMRKWITSYLRKNAFDAETSKIDEKRAREIFANFEKVEGVTNDIIGQIKESYEQHLERTAAVEPESDSGGGQRVSGQSEQIGERTARSDESAFGENARGAEKSKPAAKIEQNESYTPNGAEKESAARTTLRASDIPVESRLYQSATNAEQQQFAGDLLDKGARHATDWLDAAIDNNDAHSGATTTVAVNLMQQAARNGDLAELNRVADKIVPMLTEYGQAIQAMSMLSGFDPDGAPAYAAKLKKQFLGKDLTADELEKARSVATDLSETSKADGLGKAATEQARKAHEQAKAERDALKNALAVSADKSQKFALKLDDAARLIRSLKAKVARMQSNRPAKERNTTQTKLLTELKNKETDLLDRIRAKFGDVGLKRSEAEIAKNSILKRAEGENDSSAPDSDLVDWATIQLLEKLPKAEISVGEFKNNLDQLTGGNLSLEQIDAIHAEAVSRIRQSKPLTLERRATAKARAEHYAAADKFGNREEIAKQQAIAEASKQMRSVERDASKDAKDKYKSDLAEKAAGARIVADYERNAHEDKFTSTVLEQGVNRDFTEQAIFTTLARKTAAPAEEVVKQISSTFPELSEADVRQAIVDSGRLLDHAKEAFALSRIKAENIFNGTKEDADRIVEAQAVNAREKMIAKRAADNFYDSLVKSKRQIATETALGFRKANMLTGVKRLLTDIASNGTMFGGEEIARIPGSVADILASAATGERTLQGASVRAIGNSLKTLAVADNVTKGISKESGIKAAYNIMKYGADAGELEKLQVHSESHSGDKFGTVGRIADAYINTVFRSLSAGDALFKTMAFRRSLEEIAKVQAINEHRADKSLNINARRLEILAHPSEVAQLEAVHYAEELTFQNANAISSKFSQLKGVHGGIRTAADIFVPFDRTPTNIVLRVLDYSPVGLARAGKALYDRNNPSLAKAKAFNNEYRSAVETDTRADYDETAATRGETDAFNNLSPSERRAKISEALDKLFKQKQQREFARLFGRGLTGTAYFSSGVFLASIGLLTGSMSPNPVLGDKKESQEFFDREKKGIENRSLLIPGVGRFVLPQSPALTSLTLGATAYEQYKLAKHEKRGEVGSIMDAVSGVTKDIVFEQPLMRTLADMLGSNQNLGQRTGGIASGFIPAGAMLKDIGEVADDKTRSSSPSKQDRKQGAVQANWAGLRNSFTSKVPVLRRYAAPESTFGNPKFRGNVLRRAVRFFDITNARPATPYKMK